VFSDQYTNRKPNSGSAESANTVLPIGVTAAPIKAEFLTFFARQLAMYRLWPLGMEQGGKLHAGHSSFKELKPADQVLHQLVGDETFCSLTRSGKDISLQLRLLGRNIVSSGIEKLPPNTTVEGLLQDKHTGFDNSLLDRLAREHAAIYQGARALTDSWGVRPTLESLVSPAPKNGAGVKYGFFEPHEIDKRQVVALAITLARMSDGQFDLFMNSIEHSDRGLQPLNVAVPFIDQQRFTAIQLKAGWALRKRLEPGGSSNPSFQELVTNQELSDRDLVFVSRFGPGVMEYLRLSGEESVRHLTEIGRQIIENGYEPDHGEFVSPREGIKLLDGSTALVEPALLDQLAFENHQLWMRLRDWSKTLPDRSLHQPPRDEHIEWNPAEPVDRIWNPDRGSIYGHAFSLALFLERCPDGYQALLESARPSKGHSSFG